MSSRRYLKRVWRTPKNRGPSEYLAALTLKLLRKHGWPADVSLYTHDAGFQLLHVDQGHDLPLDFAEAVSIAVRVVARTYRVDVLEIHGGVTFNRPYRVSTGGHFVEVKE